MRIAPHCKTLRCLSVTFLGRLALFVVALQLPDVVLAQTPGPVDFAHFAYDRGVSLKVKQISVKVRGGVRILDIALYGLGWRHVPAYLVIPKGTGRFAGVIWRPG